MLRFVGITLICLGLLGLFIGGVSFTTEETVADLGPVEVEEQEQTTIPITPIASGVAIVVGAGFIYFGRRRTEE